MSKNAAVTLTQHLDAVSRRDLKTYADTVHPEALLVLPTGDRLIGKTQIVEFHRGWFADLDWSQRLQLLSMHGDEHVLAALYEVVYQDFTPEGQEIRKKYLLGLVFVRDETGQWQMLHDQCTALPDV